MCTKSQPCLTSQTLAALVCSYTYLLNYLTYTCTFILTGLPYSRKIWRGIKFGDLVVCLSTAKLKSAKFFHAMWLWQYLTIPPNLNPSIVLKTSFGAKPPNLMTANISSYMYNIMVIIQSYGWGDCNLNDNHSSVSFRGGGGGGKPWDIPPPPPPPKKCWEKLLISGQNGPKLPSQRS